MLRLVFIFAVCFVLVSALKTGLTRREKGILKKQHNLYRSQDASQGSQSASNLRKLRWNRNLAAVAQTHTDKCIYQHSTSGYGENLYISTGEVSGKGVAKVVGAWYNEKDYYHISTDECDSTKVCGHYVQVLWAPASKVGCGLKQCAEIDVHGNIWKNATLIVCNYDKIVMSGERPFNVGQPCSNCPKRFQKCSEDTGNLCLYGTNSKRGLEDILASLMERENIVDEFATEEESEEDVFSLLKKEYDEEEEEEEDEDVEMLL